MSSQAALATNESPSWFSLNALDVWQAALHRGEVAAAPAEGVYGYVAAPFHVEALQSLLEAKNRAPTKGYIVLIENLSQLSLFCPVLPEACHQAMQTYWHPSQPPTTLVLPALPTLPKLLTGGLPTIAIRLPQQPYMQSYLAAAGMPLVSTSLNLSGQPPATHANHIPVGVPALTLPYALSGTPSRIYNPLENTWLR